MKYKIIIKDPAVSVNVLKKMNIAKMNTRNSLIAEGVDVKVRRARRKLIDAGYGVTMVVTYSILSLIISTKFDDINERADSITVEQMLEKVKECSSMYSIIKL